MEETQYPHVMSAFQHRFKNRLTWLAVRLYKILWSLTNRFVFHVSSKYLINSCIVIFLLLGTDSSRIL